MGGGFKSTVVKKALSVGNNDIYSLDEGKRKGVGSGYGAFPECGPVAKSSATKLKRGQLNLCVYIQCTLSLPGLKFVPDWSAISFSSWQH